MSDPVEETPDPDLTVVFCHPGGGGWATVELMARLAARILGGQYVDVHLRAEPSRLRKLVAVLPRRRASGALLIVAAQPGHLQALLSIGLWRTGPFPVVAWVIDSFWTERIPWLARHRGLIDHLFVTDGELVDVWAQRTGAPCDWLPFGSDVVGQGAPRLRRDLDLLRVGRQPVAWNDSRSVAARAAQLGLRFQDGAPVHRDPGQNQAELLAAMADAKFTLSFNNVVAPAQYTHPTQQYLTGRWTDALAAGAVVAGAVPRCAASRELLWPEATIEVPPDDVAGGLAHVSDAVSRWTSAQAEWNHARALERLDWRLRFARLVEVGLPSGSLPLELARLEQVTAAARARAEGHAR